MKKMKYIIIAVLILALVAGAAFIINEHFYNRTIIDLTYGEIVQGKVESWTDYTDSDQIQVKINGKVYLVHSADVALIKD